MDFFSKYGLCFASLNENPEWIYLTANYLQLICIDIPINTGKNLEQINGINCKDLMNT